jgi:hypothetical protein
MVVEPLIELPGPYAEFERPPLAPVTQIDPPSRGAKDERARFRHIRQGAGIILRVWGDLGETERGV